MGARLEYDTQFEGARWDRLVVGRPEPSHDGAEVFFSRATPWEIRVKQITIYRPEQPGSPAFREYYAPPLSSRWISTAGRSVPAREQPPSIPRGWNGPMW